MNTNNIEINTQSSIKLTLDKVMYFDPFKINNNYHDADIIFITHSHYDHFDIESINNIKNDNTIIVVPASMKNDIKDISFKEYYYLNPDDEIVIDNINIKTVRAFNNDKQFHPKENNWLGYIVAYNNISYFIAGDTDKNIYNEKVKCDIALVPIGGHFTMDSYEASLLIKKINPKVVIPTHYGSIVGDISDGDKFKEYLSDTNIDIVLKI